jgi:hypothetical protein
MTVMGRTLPTYTGLIPTFVRIGPKATEFSQRSERSDGPIGDISPIEELR